MIYYFPHLPGIVLWLQTTAISKSLAFTVIESGINVVRHRLNDYVMQY